MKWKRIKCEPPDEMEGYYSRTYELDNAVCAVPSRYYGLPEWKFAVRCHFGRKNVNDNRKIEILARRNDIDLDEWKPVPAGMYSLLFDNFKPHYNFNWVCRPDDKEYLTWLDNMTVDKATFPDRLLMAFNKDFIKDMLFGKDICADNIDISFPSMFLNRHMTSIGTYLTFPDKIYGLEQSLDVYSLLEELDGLMCDIIERTNETERKKKIKEINRMKKMYEESDNAAQKIMDECAENMNMLSMKYGIDIVL